jgi:hypothetical protein
VPYGPLLAIALLRFAVPMASSLFAPVGFTADEYYYLACARQPDWGYVDHPPFSIAVLAAVRWLLGDSLVALRAVPALCEALAVMVTAALTREFGGGRTAQIVAALAVAVAPIGLLIGLPFSMNPIEHLLWPAIALVFARLLNGAAPRGWLVLGLLMGLAVENKLSALWLAAGLFVGIALAPARTCLATRWPWLGATIAALVLAPHLLWQALNDWPTLEFIRNNATGREGIDAAVVMRTPIDFSASQLLAMGPLAAPIWLSGAWALLRNRALQSHRALGFAFAIVFALLAVSGRASIYYLVGFYPVAFAAGAMGIERLAAQRSWLPSSTVAALLVQTVCVLPFVVPIVGVDRYRDLAAEVRRAAGADPGGVTLPPIYQWMSGGPEVVAAVTGVVRELDSVERRRAGVLATTFGEAGALVHHGPPAGLPPVVGTHNNFWLWGPRGVDGSLMLVVANEDSPLLNHFAQCQSRAPVRCRDCEKGLADREVFLCRDPVEPLDVLWGRLKDFV